MLRFIPCLRCRWLLAGWLTFYLGTVYAQDAADGTANRRPAAALPINDAELAIKRFQVAPGLKVDLWAAEPLLANPVAFNFDEQGRAYVCETFRLHAGVDDIRGIMDWLDEELAARTVDDRLAEMKRHLGDRMSNYVQHSERVRRLEDRAGTGKADHATVFAEGFNTPLDGIGAGVLARKGEVWFANIPNLWSLRDTNADGVADTRQSLHYGFGVRVGFLGHDLHGVHFGPDGKLYFSIGDRGSNVKLPDGRNIGDPDAGCVFRCYPDGSELEVFAFGLRNPQDLVFDQYGNLFTGDNNSDSGDQARWVYLVEGGDSGWRVGYQFKENPYSRGPFNAEKLWYPHFEGQAAYIVPPVTNIASGPSGVAYFPGTGLPARYQDHFFLVDFRGGAANSGILSFTLKPKGASFEVADPQHFIWDVLATDVKFGPDGGAYLTDWVEGWEMTGKGRIYRVHDPATDREPLVLETKKLLAEGMDQRSSKELARLLAHTDIRIRQEAQFTLADRGVDSLPTLTTVARRNPTLVARLHAIWGVGQVAARINNYPGPADRKEVIGALDILTDLLADAEPEVRAQAAKVLGERRFSKASAPILRLLADSGARVRFFAAMSLGKIGRPEAVPAILAMLRADAGHDPLLRHAGVMALTWIGDFDAILRASRDPAPAVRMAALLVMRRMQRGEIALFLHDSDPAIVLEAARAINDVPINGAMQDLAALIDHPDDSEPLVRRVLNANFHFGTAPTARALAAFVGNSKAAENMRVEALQELADWAHPSGRDRVVGLWRPVAAARQRETASNALQPGLADILRSAPDAVRVAAIRAVAQLAMTNAGPLLAALARDRQSSGDVRVDALKTLALLDNSLLEEAVKAAQADPDEDLRRAATLLEAMTRAENPAARVAARLANGTQREKQAAFEALGAMRDPAADEILGRWLDDLMAGKVAKELQLDVLEAAGKRPAESEKLAKYEASLPKDDELAPFRGALFGGNAAEGKKIFFERPEAQCVRCHRINGQGGDVGPDLSHVSAQKDREYLLQSIVFPNKQIAQGFDSVLVSTKNGDVFAGVLKSETPTELVLNSPETGVITVKKSDLATRKAALSPMPEGIAQLLPKPDLRNLVEFLAGLK
ncbi:MAG TPA: PVC-type heme-binding CxxCH protein [Methylomirabilota bacterium]|nr:PVC-type heme-binding CxxCH protein [Methylomirabilota bacterium]